jgi:hypothetical protein
MSKKECKTYLSHLVTVLILVSLLAVLFLPSVIGSQASDCKDECNSDCNDHSESVCTCIGCLPITLGYVTNHFEDSYSLDIHTYAIIDPSIDIEYDLLARVDRPPQQLLY